MKHINLIGKKFGKWTVLSQAGVNPRGYRTWICQCECGTVKEISTVVLKNNASGCGCGRRKSVVQEDPNCKRIEYALSVMRQYVPELLRPELLREEDKVA
jgi:hypothetical protein